MQTQGNFAVSSRLLTVVFGALVCAYVASPTAVAHAYLLKATKTGARVRWSDATVTMRIDPKLDQAMGKDQVRAALSMATDAWRGLPGVPRITLSDEPAPGYQFAARTNGIYLMNPWPFPKEQLAVTVSTYASNGRMIGADILVNGETEYALLSDGPDHTGMHQHDLGAVLTHEMGHVLGLDESPDDENATMWPYIRAGEVHQRTLSEDDEDGVTQAYAGGAPADASGCGQASVVGGKRAAQPVAAYGWLLALTGLVLIRRRRAV